jgi:uncharacterized protein YjbI with pentapeptide repeats
VARRHHPATGPSRGRAPGDSEQEALLHRPQGLRQFRRPATATARATAAARRAPVPVVLYVLAAVLAAVGAVRVVLDASIAGVALLAPLIGVFTVVAAGVQQMEKQREEREADRRQAERESMRRFDARFAEALKACAATGAETRIGAAAELMSFLREENTGFHQQTYDVALAHLKLSRGREGGGTAEPVVTRAFGQVLQQAAHLVLPELCRPSSERERRLGVDYRDAALDGLDLSRLELAEADLTGTCLVRAHLDDACLWRAHGQNTELRGASLRYANLEEVVLQRLRAQGADFSYANLVAARFAPRRSWGAADFTKAVFVGARLQGACFNGATMHDVKLDGANLKGAQLLGVALNEATLHSVLRAGNRSWRRARWDPEVWRALRLLDRVRGTSGGGSAEFSPTRRHGDCRQTGYRSHPWVGHTAHRSRPQSRLGLP